MPGDFIRMEPQASLESFHAFRDDRPSEEKWELIAGVPNMMPTHTLVHQRIARNLEAMLNARLWYRRHEQCHGVLFVAQGRVHPTLHSREGDSWSTALLEGPHDQIAVPDIGLIGKFGDANRHTPLGNATSS